MTDFTNEPEVKLWREVIKIALRDAGIRCDNYNASGPVTKKAAGEAEFDKRQAILFLTATSGGWRRSRELVCYMALGCPDKLCTYALKAMAKPNMAEVA